MWVLGTERAPLEKLPAEPSLLLQCVTLKKENTTALERQSYKGKGEQ